MPRRCVLHHDPTGQWGQATPSHPLPKPEAARILPTWEPEDTETMTAGCPPASRAKAASLGGGRRARVPSGAAGHGAHGPLTCMVTPTCPLSKPSDWIFMTRDFSNHMLISNKNLLFTYNKHTVLKRHTVSWIAQKSPWTWPQRCTPCPPCALSSPCPLSPPCPLPAI